MATESPYLLKLSLFTVGVITRLTMNLMNLKDVQSKVFFTIINYY
jgi:hypothetical protein